MSLFKKNRKAHASWTICIGSTEQPVTQENYWHAVDDALTLLEAGNAEFLIVAPPEPVNGFSFLQACMNSGGDVHVEAGIPQKNARVQIVYRDGLTVGEAMDLFVQYFKEHTIPAEGWPELKW